ncbi:MAG: hypothetical protein EHM78_18085 [Myxococcaceae bacterium]|nr:MAG: hypothetical protein EHM78_18085 [Myxococcaceae bacterium]
MLSPQAAGSPGAESGEPPGSPAGQLGRGGAVALSPRAWLAVAAWTLGSGLSLGDGHLDPGGVVCLVLTWAAVVAAFLSRTPEDPRRTERVLEAGVVIQLAMLMVKPPGEYLRPDLAEHPFLAPVFPVACILMAVLSATLIVDRPLLGRATFPAVVGLSGIAAAWMLVASPAPPIDVLDFARGSARALAQGDNPYDLHFPNVYGHTRYFGPGFATDESIDVGLVYPPVSLLLTAAGEWLVGDSRITLVLALIVTAVLIDRLGGRAARLAALLFVSSPRQYFVLEHGWTEPLFVCGFALLLLLASRQSRGTPVVLGALLALKQFAVLLLPLVHLLAGELRPRRSLRLVAAALLVAGLVIAPFFLRDPGAYLRSTVLFHLAQPFRPDSLNFAALWAWATGSAPPTTVPTLACIGLALLVALRRCRPTPSGFAAGSALVLLAMLAWSKQAHCNYLYLVVGMLLCSVAVADPGDPAARTGDRRTVG